MPWCWYWRGRWSVELGWSEAGAMLRTVRILKRLVKQRWTGDEGRHVHGAAVGRQPPKDGNTTRSGGQSEDKIFSFSIVSLMTYAEKLLSISASQSVSFESILMSSFGVLAGKGNDLSWSVSPGLLRSIKSFSLLSVSVLSSSKFLSSFIQISQPSFCCWTTLFLLSCESFQDAKARLNA